MCAPCSPGQACALNSDCLLGLCNEGSCQEASCSNGLLDPTETDLDCGGGGCKPCAPGLHCAQGSDCSSQVCAVGICTDASCADGTRNGTETDVDCGGGACKACPPGGHCVQAGDCHAGNCESGTCQLLCLDGKTDCNGDITDGCETNLKTDAQNCGSCGAVCSFAGAKARCIGGKCSVDTCAAPFEDCDGESANGCETDTSTSQTDCGGCGAACSAINGVAACAGGLCQLACAGSFDDCNGDPADGCESNQLTDNNNCGSCKAACQANHTVSNDCSNGACVPACASGFGDCDGNPNNGCELATATDPANCGGCGVHCGLVHANSVACVGGSCKPMCAAGWGACSNPEGGCSTSLNSAASCGACGVSCSGAAPFCVNQICKSHQEIAVVNAATSGSNAATGAALTMTHSLESPSGSYRMVAVLVAAELGQASDAPVSVTYNGVAMTNAVASWSGTRAWAGMYYILDASLPAAVGNYFVVVNPGSFVNSFVLVGNVLEFTGIDQIQPLDVTSSATGPNCSGVPPSASIGVSGAGELVVALAALFGTADTNTVVQASGQTTTLQLSLSALGGLAGLTVPVSRSLGVSWNANNCNDWGEVAASFFAASHP